MTAGQPIDRDFATSIRAELGAIGTKKSRLQRRQRRTRIALVGGVAVGVALATTGAAIVVNTFPGTTTVTPAGNPVDSTHSGTATVELGAAPAGVNSIILDITCVSDGGKISVPLTPGTVQDATGTIVDSMPETTEWDCATRSTTVHIKDAYLAPDATSITITADPGTKWRGIARYGSASTSPWGINAKGQTYGAPNKKYGIPDLQGALATNGKLGFIDTKEFNAFHGTGFINVYESDGTTVIGEFAIGTP